MKSPGEQIAAARASREMTQRKLAESIGISPAYMSQIETGVRTGSWEVICAIADALGVSVDRFRDPERPCPPEGSQPTEAA